jgi:hypothetical protein
MVAFFDITSTPAVMLSIMGLVCPTPKPEPGGVNPDPDIYSTGNIGAMRGTGIAIRMDLSQCVGDKVP